MQTGLFAYCWSSTSSKEVYRRQFYSNVSDPPAPIMILSNTISIGRRVEEGHLGQMVVILLRFLVFRPKVSGKFLVDAFLNPELAFSGACSFQSHSFRLVERFGDFLTIYHQVGKPFHELVKRCLPITSIAF